MAHGSFSQGFMQEKASSGRIVTIIRIRLIFCI